jgi:hypothetical protein
VLARSAIAPYQVRFFFETQSLPVASSLLPSQLYLLSRKSPSCVPTFLIRFRGYCTKNGSHISVDHSTLGLIDVRIGALRNFPFKSKVHLNYSGTILPMRDALPKLKDFPAEIDGSGETLPNSIKKYL